MSNKRGERKERKEEREKSREQEDKNLSPPSSFLRPLSSALSPLFSALPPLFSFLFPLSFFCPLSFLSCYPHPTIPPPSCPEGTHPNPDRAQEVLSLVPVEGARLCFGALWPSRIVTNGVYLLDERASIPETAARVGHLSLHQREAARFETPPTTAEGCAAWVDELLVLESRAYARELRLRRELQVSANPYAFEGEFWATNTEQQEGVILEYLRAHPEGGGGIDALGAGYFLRCERAQQTP